MPSTQFMQPQGRKTKKEEGGRCLVEKLGCILQNEMESVWWSQREGTGLLEYQALPSFREVAHDGWLCTFTI
jgi:hypothetical protein